MLLTLREPGLSPSTLVNDSGKEIYQWKRYKDVTTIWKLAALDQQFNDAPILAEIKWGILDSGAFTKIGFNGEETDANKFLKNKEVTDSNGHTFQWVSEGRGWKLQAKQKPKTTIASFSNTPWDRRPEAPWDRPETTGELEVSNEGENMLEAVVVTFVFTLASHPARTPGGTIGSPFSFV